MNENRMSNKSEIEIDLGRIFHAIVSKGWLVTLASVMGALIMFAVTCFLITPQYESTAMFYVNNNSLSLGDASFSISSGDLSTSRNLVDSYMVILNTRETLEDVIEYAQCDLTCEELQEMISASSVNETEIFQVTVTSPDPVQAQRIADAIAHVLPERIGTIIHGSSVKIVDNAVAASKPSSPSDAKNIRIGVVRGLLMTVCFIAVREIFDIVIRSVDDIAEVCNHPVLTTVPNLTADSKGGYYARGRKDGKVKKVSTPQKTALIGRNISFSAAEAYKLLRTKLQFSFTDDSNSRVIGLSSAISGEGKSLTSINLAYTLSQLNKKVILIDCDMRRPTLAEKMSIRKKPGLSSYLTGQSNLVDLIQNCGFEREERAFHVISAGQNPPNPVELLSSARMQRMIEILKKAYDYVILDLPPVGEVSDAMAVANQTAGMLLVVRQNACDRYALADTVRQFEFIDARILGVVFNGVNEPGGKSYYKKYYYTGARIQQKPAANQQPVLRDASDITIEE